VENRIQENVGWLARPVLSVVSLVTTRGIALQILLEDQGRKETDLNTRNIQDVAAGTILK
jgi:hypothetical protein